MTHGELHDIMLHGGTIHVETYDEAIRGFLLLQECGFFLRSWAIALCNNQCQDTFHIDRHHYLFISSEYVEGSAHPFDGVVLEIRDLIINQVQISDNVTDLFL